MSNQYDNVSVIKKSNVFFDGKCISHTVILTDGTKKSVGVILPKEVLARLKVEKGDSLFVTEAANGVVLTPYDPSLGEQLNLGREFMHEFRDTFHQLAK